MMRSQVLKAVLICFVLPSLLIYSYTRFVVYAQEKFDQGRWLSARGQIRRGRMVHDLREHRLRQGMAYSEVLQLLGPPDNEEDLRRPEDGVMDYRDLRYSVGFGYLVIVFDANGKLCNVDIDTSD